MEKNIFEYALKSKFRYPFKGQINTEDLFDLQPTALNTIFKTLVKQAKSVEEESLLDVPSKEDKDLAIKIEIVKTIFAEKNATAEAQKKAAETKLRNQRILDIIARKEEADLESKSIDELKEMLNS